MKPRSAAPRLPDFVEPMKAKLVGSMTTGGDWIYEIKFDGYRALALRCGSERWKEIYRMSFSIAPFICH